MTSKQRNINLNGALVLISVYVATTVNSMFTMVPLNTAVVQGSSVTFNCSSNVSTSYISWYNRMCVKVGDSSYGSCPPSIYDGFKVLNTTSARFNVTSNDNAGRVIRNLNIDSVQHSDAGVYVCAEIVGTAFTQINSAQLIILDKNTSCQTNLSTSGAVQEYDSFYISCSVSYNGNWPPTMMWQWRYDVTQRNINASSLVVNATARQVVSAITLVANYSSLNGGIIACITYFDQSGKPDNTTANNVPSYTQEWTSPRLSIDRLFAPQNLTTYPNQSAYFPGDTVNCSAAGNPAPSYQWTNLQNNSVISGSVLIITVDMVGNNLTFRCTATNKVNSLTQNISFMVLPAPSTIYLPSSSSTSTTSFSSGVSNPRNIAPIIGGVVGGVGGAILVVVIIIIVVCCVRRNKREKNKTKSETQLVPVNAESGDSSRALPEENGNSEHKNVHENGRTLYEPVGNDGDLQQIDANGYAVATEIDGILSNPASASSSAFTVGNNTSEYAEVMTRKNQHAPPPTSSKPAAVVNNATYAPIDHTLRQVGDLQQVDAHGYAVAAEINGNLSNPPSASTHSPATVVVGNNTSEYAEVMTRKNQNAPPPTSMKPATAAATQPNNATYAAIDHTLLQGKK